MTDGVISQVHGTSKGDKFGELREQSNVHGESIEVRRVSDNTQASSGPPP